MTIVTHQFNMTTPQWIELLRNAGITRQDFRNDRVIVAWITGPAIMPMTEKAQKRIDSKARERASLVPDWIIAVPKGVEYPTASEWVLIEEALEEGEVDESS